MNVLSKLKKYMGKRAPLLPLSLLLSASGEIAGTLPFILIWMIVLKLLSGGVIADDAVPYAWWATGLAVLGVILYFLALMSSHLAAFRVESNIRKDMMRKVVEMPLGFFDVNTSGKIRKIIDDNASVTHSFIAHQLPDLAGAVLVPLIGIVMIFAVDWRMGLVCLVPVAFLIVYLSRERKHREFFEYYGTRRAVAERIQEGLDNVQEIKSYSLVETYMHDLYADVDRNEKVQTKGELMTGIMVNGSQSILKLGLAGVILAGAGMLASGTLDIFTYIVFLVVGARIYAPVNEVLNNLAALFYLDTKIGRMNEMERMPVQQGAEEFNPDGYDIEFRNVSFSYGTGKTVLKNVSFVARQGEITALTGPSGSGKTTAAKLAARFWDADSGTITIGGVDVSGIDPEILLKSYSIVFQEVVLFNASVMDNIRIGKRDATDEEVLAAARLANCDEFVERLPHGWDTVIGENGETLSGGQRQRISIARAMLKDAPVVLLDEATASVDVENETLIQSALSELVRDRTVLIIAHRMRTVSEADRIVVLSGGEVVEDGSPEELLSRDGTFSRMYRIQALQ